MKHQTPESMKFRKLQRRLGATRRTTVGTLELLWIATQKNAPRGDIGRFSDEEIAIECEWEGDPALLVNSLVDCGWLDRCDDSRLVVHDWPEHAPSWVKRQLARHKKSFVTATNLLPVTDDRLEATPNLTQPNPTQPNPKTNAAKSPPVYPDWFEAFWSEYPANASGRKRGKGKTFGLVKRLSSGDQRALIDAANAYASEKSKFIRDPERFVKDDFWRDYAVPAERPSHLPEPKQYQMEPGTARFKLIKEFGVNEAREWSDDECLSEYSKRVRNVVPA